MPAFETCDPDLSATKKACQQPNPTGKDATSYGFSEPETALICRQVGGAAFWAPHLRFLLLRFNWRRLEIPAAVTANHGFELDVLGAGRTLFKALRV